MVLSGRSVRAPSRGPFAPTPCRLRQVRTASCGATACVNSFGDEQLAVDLLADKLLFEALRFSVSSAACSLAMSCTNSP